MKPCAKKTLDLIRIVYCQSCLPKKIVIKVKKNKTPKSLKTRGERLQYIRSLLRLTRSYIEQKYGLSVETLKVWEYDKQPLTENGLKRCMAIYRAEGVLVARNWILLGEGLAPKIAVNIKRIFEEVQEEQKGQPLDDEILMLKEADYFKSLAPNSILMLVTTEEMLPVYSPGDYIGGRYIKGKDLENAIGKDCIVKTRQGEQFFRRLIKNSTSGGYNLVCLNPSWGGTLEPVIYDVAVEWAAPVIWHRRLNN